MNEKSREAFQHFDEIAHAETRNWEDSYWHGEIINCDVCSKPMEDEQYMIDGPASFTPSPPWGNLCVVCAFKYSPRIGWGEAQLYRKFADGRWKLISGGSPEE